MKKLSYLLFSLALLLNLTGCSEDPKEKITDQNFIIAESNMKQGRYKDAVNAYYKCIKVDPKNYEAYHRMAQAQVQMSQEGGAKGAKQMKLAIGNLKMAKKLMEDNANLKESDVRQKYEEILSDLQALEKAKETPVVPAAPAPAAVPAPDTGM